MTAPAKIEYDWATLRAVSAHFGVDPRQLERDLQSPSAAGAEWCVMPVSYGYGRREFCAREGHYKVGPLPVCWQHEGMLISAFVAWASVVRSRDLDLLIETVAHRLRCLRWAEDDPGRAEPDEAHASLLLREALTKYLDTEVRSALHRVWGEPA